MTEETGGRSGSRAVDWGLLLLRIGIGIVFMVHGIPKLLAGPPGWHDLGQAMGVFGIHFAPTFWGLMGAIAEAVGGLALVLGLLVRPFAAMMLITMVVATGLLMSMQKGWGAVAHPLSLGIIFLALIFTGGGRLAVGAAIGPLAHRWFR